MAGRGHQQESNFEQEVLAVTTIVQQHTGKWVLLQVTEYDSSGWPTHGRIVQIAASRKKITDLLLQKILNGTMAKPYTILHAIPYIRTVGEWRARLNDPNDPLLATLDG